MADSIIQKSLGSYQASSTKSEKVSSDTNLAIAVTGKTVVVSYYVPVTVNMSRGDIIATLNIPSEFITNGYNSDDINKKSVALYINTKNFIADESITAGTTLRGQVVGVMK